MNYKMSLVLSLAFTCTALSQFANAQNLETFTDRGDFEEALGGVVVEDFEAQLGSDTSLTDLLALPTALGLVQITNDLPGSPNNRIDVSANEFELNLNFDTPEQESWGFDLREQVTAFGFDFNSWSNIVHNSPITLTFLDGTDFIVNPDGDAFAVGDGLADFGGSELESAGFFGFTSGSPLVSFEQNLLDTNSTGEGLQISNLTTAGAATIPEPGSVSLLALLGTLGVIRRKRSA